MLYIIRKFKVCYFKLCIILYNFIPKHLILIILKMYPDKLHIRHCMLYHFHEGINALQATKAIRSVYGEDALNQRTCKKWFARFTAGDFDLNDRDPSGRPLEANDDVLEALLEEDPKQSSKELALPWSCQRPIQQF